MIWKERLGKLWFMVHFTAIVTIAFFFLQFNSEYVVVVKIENASASV